MNNVQMIGRIATLSTQLAAASKQARESLTAQKVF